MYALNHTALNWLKEFITLGVNSLLRHNLAQCVWLVYRELDTLLYLCNYELLIASSYWQNILLFNQYVLQWTSLN